MKHDILDEGLDQIRNASPSPEQVQQASARVLQELKAQYHGVAPLTVPGDGRIQNCDDFRSLIPAYATSNLRGPRKLLVDDHLRECVRCRKALDTERGHGNAHPRRLVEPPARRSRRAILRVGWGIAAAVFCALALQTNAIRDIVWPIDVHATALTVDGGLYVIWGQHANAMTAGQRIERSQSIRTGNNSGAVLELADGSRVEMSARSELSLDRAGDGTKIHVERGNVIVTAAKQRNGHLYVETKDCTVSVVGTIFSVSAAAKGSRVSVIQGQVSVTQGNSTMALSPGQQTVTNSAMDRVSVGEDIAWSRDAESHLALLNELVAFNQDFARRIENADMRYTSNLVPLAPENTLILASLPNASRSFAEAYASFRQRIDENPQLKEWWQNNAASINGHPGVDDIVGRLTRAGAYLGPEIVIALPKDLAAEGPVILADVTSAAGLTASLQGVQTGATVSIDDKLLVVSPDPRQVQRTLGFRTRPSSNPFSRTALYGKLTQAYREGVGWLVAVDLQRLVDPSDPKVQQIGFSDVQQLLIEQKTGPNGGAYRADLGFNVTRRGMAAWLAEPAPMGVLEFVSPNAYGVAAILTKDPTLIFDDVFALLQTDPKALLEFQNYQRQNRVDIRSDLAAALGNEFLVGIDGPLLPTPSWRVVVEVNDAARLQNTIEWSVSNFNREAAAHQQSPLVLSSEAVGGRTFYALSSTHYTFWSGYLIIAPSRALLIEAIQNHDTGNTLGRSAAFRSQLPADGRDYTSGFVYQNVKMIADGLSFGLPGVPQVDALKGTVGGALPTLISLYGDPNRILISSKGVLGANIAAIAGLQGLVNAAGVLNNSR